MTRATAPVWVLTLTLLVTSGVTHTGNATERHRPQHRLVDLVIREKPREAAAP
jgi:hypothetical protein